MLFALFCLTSSVLSLSYKKGETFSYKYNSVVRTSAEQTSNADQSTLIDTSCVANFKVLMVSSAGAYIEMIVNKVATTVSNVETTEKTQEDEETEEYYSNPIYFVHLNDGAIDKVAASDEDSEDLISFKVGIIYSLQTAVVKPSPDFEQVSVIDPQGSHFEFFQASTENDVTTIQSYYTEKDFVAFADENASSEYLTIGSSSSRQIVGDRIVSSQGQMTAVLNHVASTSNEDEEDAITILSLGASELSGYAQGNTEEVEFPYESVEEFMSNNIKYHEVESLNKETYRRRRPHPHKVTPEEEQLDTGYSCPAGLDVCRGFDQSWTAGNSNCGLRFSASAVAGVSKGCVQASRSYMAGAYADIDVLIVGFSIKAANAYAEYGQMYGSPLRNAIELKVFGVTIYKKTFPWIDCIDRSIDLINFSKDYSISYHVLVYIVDLKFSVGVTLGFSANLHYTACPQDLKASITLTPRASAKLHGGASASVAVARAGVEISGTIADYLDPTAYVDGNICRVGFYMYNNLEPVDVRLEGWYQTRTIKHWKITWGSKHTHTFWHHTWAAQRTKIIDVFYGAK